MAHYIKKWRKHRGLTQEKLAERIGMARSYLALIESGKRRYDQTFLERAADALDCSPAELVMRDPSDPDGLWAIYDKLTETERQQAVQLLRALFGGKTGADG